MQFVYPQFLFALFALAIPVIIHLFNFRRYKKVFFPNIRFLQHIEKEAKSRNKLRHLLLLLMRLLALAAIVLAFAQPFIPRKDVAVSPGKKYISIFIDNSFSMGMVGTEGELLSEARKHAETIARQYSEADGFKLLTNNFDVSHTRWMNREEFISAVQDVEQSPAFRTVNQVLQRMQEGMRDVDSTRRLAYIISDFQQPMAQLNELPEKSNFPVSFVQITSRQQNNIFIDSVWFENPVFQVGQRNELSVKIVNASGQAVEEGTVTLQINNKQAALSNFNIAEGRDVVVKLVFTASDASTNLANVSITDYPITFDDFLYFSFKVDKSIPVLSVNGLNASRKIRDVFSPEASFVLTEVPQGGIDYSKLSTYRFVVLNELTEVPQGLAVALRDFVSKGGNVAVIPPADANYIGNYRNFLNALGTAAFENVQTANLRMSAPADMQQAFYLGMFEEGNRNTEMPLVRKYYSRAGNFTRAQQLLRLSNDAAILTSHRIGAGNFYVFSISLNPEWSTFTQHGLFLPVFYQMALLQSVQPKLYNFIGRDEYLLAPKIAEDKEQVYILYKQKDSFEIIPPQRMVDGRLSLFVEGLLENDGHYNLRMQKQTAQPASDPAFSFNFDRRESVMEFADIDEWLQKNSGYTSLQAKTSSLAASIKNLQQGAQLWKWFILAALLFLLAETLIVRLWK